MIFIDMISGDFYDLCYCVVLFVYLFIYIIDHVDFSYSTRDVNFLIELSLIKKYKWA